MPKANDRVIEGFITQGRGGHGTNVAALERDDAVFSTYSPYRRPELLALRWRHVNLERQMCGSKRQCTTATSMTPKPSQAFARAPLVQGQEPCSPHVSPDILVSWFFQRGKGTPLDQRTLLHRQLKPVSQKLRLAGLTWHSLRHANATLHDTARTPLGTLQAFWGMPRARPRARVYLHAY